MTETEASQPEASNPFVLPDPIPREDVKEWDLFGAPKAIQQWRDDLKVALRERTPEAWELAGRMAMLVTHPWVWGLEAADRVSFELDIPLRTISPEELVKLPPLDEWPPEVEPTLLVIEPGAAGEWGSGWQRIDHLPEKEPADEVQRSVIEWLGRSLPQVDPSCGVILACFGRSLTGHSPQALRQPGLLDRFIELPEQPLEIQGRWLFDWRLSKDLGAGMFGATITAHPARFARLFHDHFDLDDARRVDMAGVWLRRLHRRIGRPIEFHDVVQLSIRGFMESAEQPIASEFGRRSTAYHEAGHALVAIVDSDEDNVPETATILPAQDFTGVVVAGADYAMKRGNQRTFAQFRHIIRVKLAGRAAEELAMGKENITDGCRSDLEGASDLAIDGFAKWGFVPGMDVAEDTGTNLLVDCVDSSRETGLQAGTERVLGLARKFLQDEYRHVLGLLTAHRAQLDLIAGRLMAEFTLDREQILATYRQVRMQ